MIEKLRIVPEAVADLTDAYLWYEQRRPGLGEEFLGCVDACINLIRRNPELFEVVYEDYCRALVRRFPYSLFYEYAGDAVILHAVLHAAQDPEKWRRRLNSS